MDEKEKIPKRNILIVTICLTIIGGIVFIYSLIGKELDINLLSIIGVLFVIVLALLEHSGIKISKGINWIKHWRKYK